MAKKKKLDLGHMQIKPPFFLREELNDNILALIKSVTLGSNGTLYQHQRIDRRIKQLYHPLFVNLEHRDKVLGNVTICRRPSNWYVRYFAFDLGLQSGKQKPRSKAANSSLKNRIQGFFDDAFLEECPPKTFYAYIDPKNERSLWMSQNFKFKTIAKIATQTFSRVKPIAQANVSAMKVDDSLKSRVQEIYGNYPFYFTHHTFNDDPFYVLTIADEIVAFAKVHQAEWKIKRLSGKYGSFLKAIVPYIPRVRKIVRPDQHIFSVVDTVWSKGNNPAYLNQLFEGILHGEKTNSLVWWVDRKEPVFQEVQNKIDWGLLHKINGVQDVDLVVRTSQLEEVNTLETPSYVTGFDFI